MPLQNRVDPFGAIHAVADRGALMGNRGIIHDASTRTLTGKRWTSRAWIICLCRFKQRRRAVMAPGTYTELFFLDEATALAAGHRPCFECQRMRATAFASAFAMGQGRDGMRAAEIDRVLHGERLAAGKAATALSPADIASLPDGAMVAAAGAACLLQAGRLHAWSFGGYARAIDHSQIGGDRFTLITPPATIAAMRSGYRAASALETAA